MHRFYLEYQTVPQIAQTQQGVPITLRTAPTIRKGGRCNKHYHPESEDELEFQVLYIHNPFRYLWLITTCKNYIAGIKRFVCPTEIIGFLKQCFQTTMCPATRPVWKCEAYSEMYSKTEKRCSIRGIFHDAADVPDRDNGHPALQVIRRHRNWGAQAGGRSPWSVKYHDFYRA
jgi:hypothetical protein